MRQFQLGTAALLVVLAACSDPTKPVDLASIASISLTPALTPIVKDSKELLTLSARDSAGREVRVGASWTSSSPAIATVSSDGIVSAVGYGSANITAVVGSKSATATVVVTAKPTTKAYSVADLGGSIVASGITRHFSDSGDVLVSSAAVLYRHGVAMTLNGCGYGVAVNGQGHVLCKTSALDSVSSYAIWHDGNLTPLATADTFEAGSFRGYALSDSDEVPGLFFRPAFVNAKCPASGTQCLAVWKDGVPSFPGVDAGYLGDAMHMNNRGQVALESAMWAPDLGMSTMIYEIPTGRSRSAPWGVQALNDNGWAAIGAKYVVHSPGTAFLSMAYVSSPDSLIALGSGRAGGINNSNVVVGTLDIGPFIWRGQGVSLLTNATTDPSWTITAADEINNRGQILATADNSDGRKGHTVILTPSQP